MNTFEILKFEILSLMLEILPLKFEKLPLMLEILPLKFEIKFEKLPLMLEILPLKFEILPLSLVIPSLPKSNTFSC